MYQPLDAESCHIRILHLNSGTGNDVLEGSLECVRLEEHAFVSFETISYCWETTVRSASISIADERLEIPRSAHAALRRFRKRDSIRSVWIDSVCINQGDLQERGHQVARMHAIYSHASANLIFLGDDENYRATDAFAGISALSRDILATIDERQSFRLMVTEYGAKIAMAPAATVTFSVPFNRRAVLDLLSRPWFRRLWIVQEATLACSNTCYWGDGCLPLSDILRAAVWLRYKQLALGSDALSDESFGILTYLFDTTDRAEGWLYTHFPQQDASPISALLGMLRDFEASDARDHIYGMIGLYRHYCPAELPLQILPDYTKSVAEVFAEATRLCLLDKLSLDAWQYFRYRRASHHAGELPSWVPPWDAITDLTNDNPLFAPHFQADENTKAQLTVAPEVPWNRLGVVGFVIGSVSKCSHVCDYLEDWAAFITDPAASWFDSKIKHDLNTERWSLNRTLMADNIYGERVEKEDIDRLDDLKSYIRDHACVHALFPGSQGCQDCGENDDCTDGELPSLRRYADICWAACAHRRLFTTSEGGPGLGPATLCLGDVIVILYGGTTTYAIREHSPEFWTLVGECYVDGVMHGEAMRDHRREGRCDQTFMIL